MKQISTLFLFTAIVLLVPSYALAQFTESFESTDLPAGWKIINVAGGTNATWRTMAGELGLRPHDGNRMVTIDGNFFSSSPPHNDYLVTPSITVQAGISDYISFYARNGTTMNYADVFNLKVSVTGNEVADFNTTLQTGVKATTSWSQYGFDLSDYVGQTIYVAIHNDTYDGGKHLYLDYFVNGPKPALSLGCTEASEGQYPSGSFDARNCTGEAMEIVDDAYAGEYSVVRVKGGNTYNFSTSNPADYVTIATHNSVRTVLAHGVTPVVYTPVSDGSIRFYNHAGSNCSSERRFRTKMVSCGTPLPPLVNDEATGAIEVAVGAACTGNAYVITRATAAPDEPVPGCGLRENAGAKTLWFKFVAPESGLVRISTDFAGTTLQDPRMALYAVGDPADYSTFTNLACDDDGGVEDEGWKSVIFYAGLAAGQTYYVQVEEYEDFYEGDFCLQVEEIDAPMLSASTSCSTNSNEEFGGVEYGGWTSLTDEEGRIIALVRNSRGMPGNSTSEALNIHEGPVRKDRGGNYYLSRNFSFVNESTTGPYEVVLFFLKSELEALTAVDPAAGIGTLGVSRQADADCTADFDGSAGEMTALPVTESGLTSEVGWVKFETPSFSNFFLNSAGVTLPVTWSSFTAEIVEGEILLNWSTVRERQNSGFYIERSTDASSFSILGWKNSIGDADGESHYGFTDSTAPHGTLCYYQIRQVDYDGTESLSPIRSVVLDGKGIRLGPNPAGGEVTLKLPGIAGISADIRLTDARGVVVRHWRKREITAVGTVLETHGLSSGLYFVQVNVNGITFTDKLLIDR